MAKERLNNADPNDIAREIRRNQSNLVVLGMGVIAFGIWSVIKFFMYVLLMPEFFDGAGEEAPESIGVKVVAWIFISIFLAMDLLLRLNAGRRAVAEGRGAGRQRFYVGYAIVMSVVYIAIIALEIVTLKQGSSTDSTLDILVSIVVDITSVFVLIKMVISAKAVRRLTAELERMKASGRPMPAAVVDG